MEKAEKTNTNKRKYSGNEGYFIEYFNHLKGQHIITAMGYVDGKKRCVIGRIFPEKENPDSKITYRAVDALGNPIFQEVKDLRTIKKYFKEQVTTLALATLVDQAHLKAAEASQNKDRETDLKELRYRSKDEKKENNIEKGKGGR